MVDTLPQLSQFSSQLSQLVRMLERSIQSLRRELLNAQQPAPRLDSRKHIIAHCLAPGGRLSRRALAAIADGNILSIIQ